MKTTLSLVIAAVALSGLAAPAHADTCSEGLVGKSLCMSFEFSQNGTKSATATFFADGSFTLDGVKKAGKYTCAGGHGLLEVDYKDKDGRQVWYVQAGPGGNHLSGNGKAIDVGYMYALTSAVGACTAE